MSYLSGTPGVPLWVSIALPGILQSCLYQEERWVFTLSHFQAGCFSSPMCSMVPSAGLG